MATRTKAARTTATKAGKAAAGARSNPYVQRFVEDPELRDNVRDAIEHARVAYKRMSNGKKPAKALMEDRKLQKELRRCGRLPEGGRRPAARQEAQAARPKLLLLVVVGTVAFIILNEGARKALMDRIFGAEEEFEYTSTTTPA